MVGAGFGTPVFAASTSRRPTFQDSPDMPDFARSLCFRGLSLAAVAAPLVLSLGGCAHEKTQAATAQPPAANVVSVERGSISHTLALAGQFQPYQVVDVHAKVSGYIRQINVDIGDKVRAGQTLAVLEVPELAAQLAGVKLEVARAKDEITRAQNDVIRAESTHSALHSNWIRMRDTAAAQPGLIAQQELDDAHAKDLSAEAQVDASKSALSAAQQQAGVASADLQRVSALEDYTDVVSPLTGVVIWRYADTGDLIQAGTSSDVQSRAVVKVSQSDLLRLRLPVPESAVRYIHQGSLMKVRVDALNRSFVGRVVRFTRNLSIQTRTMETEIDVPNPDLSIDPGMYANVIVELEHRDNVLTIPDGAVVRNGTQDTVMVLDQNNRISEKPITLGIQGSTLVEVTSGLQEGDRVINGGQSKYQAGEEVHPIEGTYSPNNNTKDDASETQGGGQK
jgi:RND family efflux transporter MFP subunit